MAAACTEKDYSDDLTHATLTRFERKKNNEPLNPKTKIGKLAKEAAVAIVLSAEADAKTRARTKRACGCEVIDGKCCFDERCRFRRAKIACGASCGPMCENQGFAKSTPVRLRYIPLGNKIAVAPITDIQKGDYICLYTGELSLGVPVRDTEYVYPIMRTRYIKLFVDASDSGSELRMAPHSEDPNAYIEEWIDGGFFVLVARAKHDIEAGTPITLYYPQKGIVHRAKFNVAKSPEPKHYIPNKTDSPGAEIYVETNQGGSFADNIDMFVIRDEERPEVVGYDGIVQQEGGRHYRCWYDSCGTRRNPGRKPEDVPLATPEHLQKFHTLNEDSIPKAGQLPRSPVGSEREGERVWPVFQEGCPPRKALEGVEPEVDVPPMDPVTLDDVTPEDEDDIVTID